MNFVKIAGTIVIFFIVLLPGSLIAREFSVSGRVTDAGTGKPLPGANVFVPKLHAGVITDSLGFYELLLQEGEYRILFSYLGYEEVEIILHIKQDTLLDVELGTGKVSIEEVIISARPPGINLEQTQMSSISLNIETMRNIPAFLGEVDLLRTVQLLPGVQSAGDGTQDFMCVAEMPIRTWFCSMDLLYIMHPTFSTFSLYLIRMPSKTSGFTREASRLHMVDGCRRFWM
jgi:hypothetical protein